MLIEVSIPELSTASQKIKTENQNFRDAAKSFKTAADDLNASWEGDTHDKFVMAIENRNKWYTQMAELVDNYIVAMENTAKQYEEMDQSGARIIRSK